jgi:glycosyltransferase involved in cell wall biosynthesis
VSQIPLLFLADAITSSTGLSRVCRDLATRVHSSMQDTFRVGTLGVGGPISTSSRFPFPNYSIIRLQQMVPTDLPLVWEDFAGRYGDELQEDSEQDLQERRGQIRKGAMTVIWNLSWLQWLAQPYLLPLDHPVRNFLLRRPPSVSQDHWAAISNPSSPSFSPQLLTRLADSPFERWLYCPVDGHLPDGTLGHQLAPILQGFTRLLAYTRYGADVIERTLEKWGGQSAVSTIGSIPNLPHGLDRSVFHPRPRAEARQTFFSRASNGGSALPLLDDQVLACCINTNSSRKDYGLAFATCAELLRRGMNIFLWCHTDALTPHPSSPAVYWNLPALAKQFGLQQRICVTTERLTDDALAWAMSAADIGLHIGAGEGFGYFGPQAIACGIPVVHGNYAGGAEVIPSISLVPPSDYYLEATFMIQRPIFRACDWADKVEELLKPENRVAALTLPQELEWDGENGIWGRWAEWLRKGVTQ